MSRRRNYGHNKDFRFNYNLVYVLLIVAIICMFTISFVFLFALNEIERYEKNPSSLNTCESDLVTNGNCESLFVGFVYEDGVCIEKKQMGCGAIIPFSSHKDCMQSCFGK